MKTYLKKYLLCFTTDAKQEMSKAQTESKQCTMQLVHDRTQLANKQKEMKQTESDYAKDKNQLDTMQKDLQLLEVRYFRVLLLRTNISSLKLIFVILIVQ